MMLWMHQSWIADMEEKAEFQKSFAIFQGSFANPEMAKSMMNADEVESDDESYEATLNQMREERKIINKNLHRRKRKVITTNG